MAVPICIIYLFIINYFYAIVSIRYSSSFHRYLEVFRVRETFLFILFLQ